MIEPTGSNLEPIGEEDLNLKEKFLGGEGKHFPEKPQPFEVEKEIPQEISSSEKDDAYSKILSKVQSQVPQNFNPADITKDAEEGARKTDAESQIQHLIDIAQQKGVIYAVKVAQHMENNYILDLFHDRMLSDELHNALLAKGLIEEI
jgi:hypothetical protein